MEKKSLLKLFPTKMESGYGLVNYNKWNKKFKLQYKNNLNKSSISDQTVIILVDNESNSVPKVARVFRSDVENIDMLNLEKLNDAITLDFLSYSPPGLIIMSGRTTSILKLKFLSLQRFLEDKIKREWSMEIYHK